MTLSPGDTIQIILTVGGVPYAKTRVVSSNEIHPWMKISPYEELEAAMNELWDDIDLYANETESSE